jgi:hypothetical protein
MELWDALRQDPHLEDRLYEVFPTASWTIWHGPRGDRKREDWSHEALMTLPLQLPDVKWTQDLRDAVGAALTIRSLGFKRRRVNRGQILVPFRGRPLVS